MSTPLLVILAVGALLGCWAALTLMGGERATRLNQIQAQRPAAPVTPVISVQAAPVAVAKPPAPVKPKPAKPQAAAGAAKNPR
jgi:hypothetical protein